MSMLYTRMHTIKDLLQAEVLTPNSIKQSGVLWYCLQEFQKDGVLGYEQFAKVGEKYDLSKISNNGYEYFNTFLLREYVTETAFKELYNIDVIIQKR
jgi:hypothetical protein